MKKLIFVLLCIILLATNGCRFHFAEVPVENNAYVVTDELGRTVKIPHKPQRIVSTTYGTDEVLLDLVDISRIVGLSKYAGNPDITFVTEAQREAVGHVVELNPENIMELNPDLVIISSAVSNGITEVLSGMGVPVYVSVTATTWDEVELKVQGMAKAVGESERGDQVVSRMRMKRKAIEEKLSVLSPNQEKTVVALSFRGIIGKRGTLFNEILKMAHVKNGADGIDIPKGAGVYLSNELIPSINPDVFLLPVWKTREGDDENEFKKELMQNSAYQDVKAVKNNQFIFFSERYKYVMSQHVTDSVEAVARAVYPELWE